MCTKTNLKYILLIAHGSEIMPMKYIIATTDQIELMAIATMLANKVFREAISRQFCETMKHYLTGSCSIRAYLKQGTEHLENTNLNYPPNLSGQKCKIFTWSRL